MELTYCGLECENCEAYISTQKQISACGSCSDYSCEKLKDIHDHDTGAKIRACNFYCVTAFSLIQSTFILNKKSVHSRFPIPNWHSPLF